VLRLQEQVGQRVSLLTLHFVESQNQGATLLPRLAGFLSQRDRDFFELFTTCKGVGNKRALRAMSMEPAVIAMAIADRDIAQLQLLPEIGKRMAETIIATLHGKVDRFLAPPPGSPAGGTRGQSGTQAGGPPGSGSAGGVTLARQALEVLIQLGEQRSTASIWIDQALRDPQDRPADVQALIARVYRIKSGV